MKIIELTIVQCVCAKVRDGKMLNHDYKNNNGHNFQFTKFSFNDFALTDRGSLLSKRLKSACGKSSSCRFSVTAARYAITKATEYVAFGFYFHRKVSFLLGRGGMCWGILDIFCEKRMHDPSQIPTQKHLTLPSTSSKTKITGSENN